MLLRGFLCKPAVIQVPCTGMDIGGNTNQPNNGMNIKGDGVGAQGRSESKKNANQMQSTQEQDSETAHHSTQGGGTKAGVFRFSFARDRQLLLEVKELNPFAALNPVKVWDVIRHNMFTIFGMSGSHRTFADRTKLLIQKQKANETQYLKRSGVDEEFTAFRALLLEVVQIYDDAAKLKEKDTLWYRPKGIDARNECLQELEDVDANGDVDEPGESYAVYEQSLAAVCVNGDNNNQPQTPLFIASMSCSPTPGPTSPTATGATSTKVFTKGSKRPMDSYGRNEGGTPTKQQRGEVLQYLQRKHMMELEVKQQELRIREIEANKRTAELEMLKQKEETESQRFQATMDLLEKIRARVKVEDSSKLQMNANTGAESEAEDQINTTLFPLQVNNPGDMLEVQLNVDEDPPVFNGIPNKCTCNNFNRDDQTLMRTLNKMYEEQCRANLKTEEYRAKKMKLLEEQAKYPAPSIMALYQ